MTYKPTMPVRLPNDFGSLPLMLFALNSLQKKKNLIVVKLQNTSTQID